MTNSKEKGKIGEDVACRFLESKGFSVVERNYLKKWGEIDIIAKNRDKDTSELSFIEVKSVVRDFYPASFVFHGPEENVHALKTRRLKRVIETYLTERAYGFDYPFNFHVVCVYLNVRTRRARVKWLKNVIL
jgi:putative endonuclease